MWLWVFTDSPFIPLLELPFRAQKLVAFTWSGESFVEVCCVLVLATLSRVFLLLRLSHFETADRQVLGRVIGIVLINVLIYIIIYNYCSTY